MIKVHQITKYFGTQRALHQVNVDVPEGSTLAIIGPSGCGKSTLLRIMIGLITPDEGEIHFGKDKLDKKNTDALRKRIGYVIQKGGLFPHMSARKNVTLAAEYFGWSESDISHKVNELSELVHISTNLLDKKPTQLSGGEAQRVSLMRALMLDPDYILMDEPLGSIDPLVRNEMQSELKEIFSKLNKTVVLVTHDLGEAAYLGDELLLMKDGGVVQRGSIKTILNKPANDFVSDFINAQRSLLHQVEQE
ncbi:ATP-binding cassette domain-containing protein [Balneola vulgaris]|uniref:ATP-binding cassette domain-containing protein n=1 Tax=Balneola vulgaris TaxID=287535 RepID=UPI000379A5C4|nr:ATP-binding cassette domain-containing protein [Balneola vulgaris]